MTNTDPNRDRADSLRRSRAARRVLVLGAVAGSLGIAGVLGFSAAVNPGAPASSGSTSTQGNQTGTSSSQGWILQGGDDGGESDDGQNWVPAQPSTQFSSGGGAVVTPPHATSGGS